MYLPSQELKLLQKKPDSALKFSTRKNNSRAPNRGSSSFCRRIIQESAVKLQVEKWRWVWAAWAALTQQLLCQSWCSLSSVCSHANSSRYVKVNRLFEITATSNGRREKGRVHRGNNPPTQNLSHHQWKCNRVHQIFQVIWTPLWLVSFNITKIYFHLLIKHFSMPNIMKNTKQTRWNHSNTLGVHAHRPHLQLKV